MQRSLNCKRVIVFLFVLVCAASAQTSDTIRQKNKELEKIKQDISTLEKELQTKSKKERESLQSLENINKQNHLLDKLINNLLSEEKDKEEAVNETEQNAKIVEKRIAELKAKYSQYVVWIYKNRGLSIWRFVLDSQSFNQAIKRYRYLKYISEENANTLKLLTENKDRLNSLMIILETERAEKERLANQKMNEQEALQKKEKEKHELLKVLKSDKKLIAQEISAKRKAEVFIKNFISRLIEAERDRKAKNLKEKATSKKSYAYKKNSQNFDYSGLENFEELKGRLGWPIREGKIIRNFGENKNQRLNTVTVNYGIDIAVKGTENVLSIAEGYVSAIDWIPGYGSIVIITHRDEYRTVYGHLTNIAVKEGARIKSGSVIGKVNESLEGNILHFEIWSGRNYQNPDLWLARK